MIDYSPTKVLIVDDHKLFRDGIRLHLESIANIVIVGEANNGKEAIEAVESTSPDLVLMDIEMPIMNGLDTTKILHQQNSTVKIIMLSMHDQIKTIIRAMGYGAAGYMLKDISGPELAIAIERVMHGKTYFSSSVSRAIFNCHKAGSDNVHHTNNKIGITEREQTVLVLLAQGLSSKEIASKLNISVRTIETHRRNIRKKLNIHNSAGLTRYAIENNVVNRQ